MANEIIEQEELSQELKTMQVCRFCLSRNRLSGIFVKPANLASLAPLTVQVMACASIEIFTNDGMPSLICHDCRLLFEHSYRFKQMCKRADTLLRQYPLTGNIPQPLSKPRIPQSLLAKSPTSAQVTSNMLVASGSGVPSVKKILNAAPASAPEQAVQPMRFTFKTEPNQDAGVQILNKVDVGDEISMEDVQKIIANAGDEDFIYANDSVMSTTPIKNSPPKLLNKATKRTLNIDLTKSEAEPQFSKPKMHMNTKGQMELVTAIVQPNDKKHDATDPTQNAEPVVTDNFPCPFCERSFPLLQLRDIHLTRHNRERNFQCPDCDRKFFSKYDLQKHEVRHTGERPFPCTICGKAFTRSTLLHRHEKVHTDVPKFLCIYCEKPFISKNELETHIGRHEKNRPFKCQQCGKSFAFKQGLERHEVVHSAVLPYPCQYCDQSFTTPSKLSRHLNAHAGDRPFPCKYCNKSYMLSHHLTRHLRSHKQAQGGEHNCSECKKSFKTREDLIYHTAVHSTTNLICTLCQQQFQTASEVTAHIKMHIDANETFACEFCDLLFLTADELLMHYENHTTEVEEFKYETNVPVQPISSKKPKQKQQQQKPTNNLVETLDGDDEDVMKRVNEIFESNSKQQQEQEQQELTVLDGDDENVVATINKIFNYEASSDDDDDDVAEVNNSNNNNDDGNNKLKQQQLNSPEKPKILNQIVFSTANMQNIIGSSSTAASTVPVADAAPTNAKTRKVIARDGKLQVVPQSPAVAANKQRSPRRKVPEKPTEIKIEKEDLKIEGSSLVKLPVLPKGVTLRKTTTATTTAAAKPNNSGGSSTAQKPLKKMSLAEAQAAYNVKRVKEAASKTTEKSPTRVINTRRSGGNATPATGVANNSSRNGVENKANTSTPSTSKPQQQRSAKVKQIRMTKAMADELAKQGRIKFKDGNMILTKPSK